MRLVYRLTLVYLVIYDSGKVSLEHLLLSRQSSQSQPTLSLSSEPKQWRDAQHQVQVVPSPRPFRLLLAEAHYMRLVYLNQNSSGMLNIRPRGAGSPRTAALLPQPDRMGLALAYIGCGVQVG